VLDHPISDIDFFLQEAHPLCYLWCTGIALAPGCDSCCNIKYKLCCYKCQSFNASPLDEEGDFCSCLATCCWYFYSQCKCPPQSSYGQELNPICACCGYSMRDCTKPAQTIGPQTGARAHSAKKLQKPSKIKAVKAPAQQEMV
jgi:hypothetical protein